MPARGRDELSDVTPPSVRTAEDLREAALGGASEILGDPRLRTDAEREEALRDVLDALGLRNAVPRATQLPCGGFPGTLAGYRWHVRAYSTPCNACLNARTAELDARWNALGIDVQRNHEVVLPI